MVRTYILSGTGEVVVSSIGGLGHGLAHSYITMYVLDARTVQVGVDEHSHGHVGLVQNSIRQIGISKIALFKICFLDYRIA